jgi:hypothetical protein
MKLHRNFSQRTHLNHTIGPKTWVLVISDRFVTVRESMQNWPNWHHYRISSVNEVAFAFFTTNAPYPLHWTQNSCFGHFGPFRYCMNDDAKLAELAPLTHKFAKRSCVGSFRNEHTRSTPLDPKLMFCGVSDPFVTARNSMQNRPN